MNVRSLVIALSVTCMSTEGLAEPRTPKERWEASADGRTAICTNFRETRILGAKPVKTLNVDKGQTTAVREVVDAVRAGGVSPLRLDEIVAVSRATFAVHEAVRTERWVSLT